MRQMKGKWDTVETDVVVRSRVYELALGFGVGESEA